MALVEWISAKEAYDRACQHTNFSVAYVRAEIEPAWTRVVESERKLRLLAEQARKAVEHE